MKAAVQTETLTDGSVVYNVIKSGEVVAAPPTEQEANAICHRINTQASEPLIVERDDFCGMVAALEGARAWMATEAPASDWANRVRQELNKAHQYGVSAGHDQSAITEHDALNSIAQLAKAHDEDPDNYEIWIELRQALNDLESLRLNTLPISR